MKKTYPIPPDKTLMEDIGATSFSLAEAIVELVANSIDARTKGSTLHVDITVDPKMVIVKDDAEGMKVDVLVQAVRLGVKMDDILGMRKRKGMYGLGLKTAAASIGRYWAVITRAKGENVEHFLEFDLQKFKNSKTGSINDWEVEVETRERATDSILGDRDSGTAVIITQLRDEIPMSGSVLTLLGDAYKPHIESGELEISVNGTLARPTGNNFIQDSQIEFDEIIGEPGKRWHVRGWVALDSKTHNKGDYGFNLYREDQLIETWDKSWFRAHLMTSRIIGEAHIDFMPVNFNKQGFQTQSDEWRLTKEHMKGYLKPVVKASEDANKGRNDETKIKRAVQGLKRALGGMHNTEATEDPESGTQDKPKDKSVEQQKNSVSADGIIIKGKEIVPTYTVADYDSEVTLWDYMTADFDDGKRTEVQAVLNSSSELFKQTKDEVMLGCIALADCVTTYLVERCSMPAPEARELRDQWVYASLVKKSRRSETGGPK